MRSGGTRAEHITWCKKRALEYLQPGQFFDPSQAVASMLSDLGKHDETRDMLESSKGIAALGLMSMRSADDARRFVEGFN